MKRRFKQKESPKEVTAETKEVMNSLTEKEINWIDKSGHRSAKVIRRMVCFLHIVPSDPEAQVFFIVAVTDMRERVVHV